ncbi:hypothetical protein M9H77_36030 [Catharanthus roseus]|uniref:Uncharacterized protein n=1 Tax=Catharanthus roseus TaxID=4058 RepID=A0ACB9ZRH5_CATRO|nr:hypothetical protein M9H77_36030 [Catharanthus roseus]
MAGRPEGGSLRETFTGFYENWHIKHQEILEKLIECVENEEEEDQDHQCQEEIFNQVLSHYQEFFQEKSKAANEDVFLVISAPWFSSFERALIWVSAFRPSMLFSLIKNSIGEDLGHDQQVKIEAIKVETKREEKAIEEEFAKVQESVADSGIFPLLRRFERIIDGEISELDNAMEELKKGMIMVVEEADVLRGLTVKKLMEVLNPIQNLKFLIAAVQFVARARTWGLYKDSIIITTTRDD